MRKAGHVIFNQGDIMPIASIIVDTYKVSIFKKNLETAGFSWTEHPGINKTTKLLKVEFTSQNFKKLEQSVRVSNAVSIRRN